VSARVGIAQCCRANSVAYRIHHSGLARARHDIAGLSDLIQLLADSSD